MDIVVILFVALMVACAFGFLGGWVAGEKGRSRNEGALIGFLFGPLGVLILVLLPSKEARPSPPARRGRSGASRKSRLTAWEIPDDWEPNTTVSGPDPKAKDEDEDRALRYLSGGDN